MSDNDQLEPTRTKETSFIDFVLVVWERRWAVGLITMGFAMAGLLLALLLPRVYQATATVYPVTSTNAGLSQYSGLAALAGVSLPGVGGSADPAQTVNALLTSRVLVETLVSDMGLVQKLLPPETLLKGKSTDDELFARTVGLVQRAITTSQDKGTGVISISLELQNPSLAQQATNRLVEILDTMLGEKSLTTTKKRLEQLDRQIAAQRAKLDQYQNEMAKFQKDTSLLDPKAQSNQAFDALTNMVQQRITLEVQLSTAQASYSPDNPKITLLRSQLNSIERQISEVKNQVNGDLPSLKDAPENLIRYQNLATDLDIATKIYAGLLASLEQARLQDDKDEVYVEPLDRALLPTVGKPNGILVIALMSMLGFAIGCLLAFVPKRFFSWARLMVTPKVKST